jgi:methylated-DNA-[protein]-cysteine S-methyltransferase
VKTETPPDKETLQENTMKFDTSIVQTSVPSPLGSIVIAASRKGLAGLWFAENQRYLPTATSGSAAWPEAADHPLLQKVGQQLGEYFAGQRSHFDVPLDLSCGTAFQQSVWQALLAIAPGEVISYGEVSRRIGNPTAVRAVGGAVGRNPVSIIVPCHRVMGTNGALTGYGGGLERKTALLRLEGALPEELL